MNTLGRLVRYRLCTHFVHNPPLKKLHEPAHGFHSNRAVLPRLIQTLLVSQAAETRREKKSRGQGMRLSAGAAKRRNASPACGSHRVEPLRSEKKRCETINAFSPRSAVQPRSAPHEEALTDVLHGNGLESEWAYTNNMEELVPYRRFLPGENSRAQIYWKFPDSSMSFSSRARFVSMSICWNWSSAPRISWMASTEIVTFF